MKSILLIDDDLLEYDMIYRKLGKLCHIAHAPSFYQGIKFLENTVFDLVVVDTLGVIENIEDLTLLNAKKESIILTSNVKFDQSQYRFVIKDKLISYLKKQLGA